MALGLQRLTPSGAGSPDRQTKRYAERYCSGGALTRRGIMVKIRFFLGPARWVVYLICIAAVSVVSADSEPADEHNNAKNHAGRILTAIQIDMTPKDVEYILGKPDKQTKIEDRQMDYGRFRIYFTEENLVREITYGGKCGFVPVKNQDFNILNDPGAIRPFVIEALSRNDLLCPSHAFERRINECVSEIIEYLHS